MTRRVLVTGGGTGIGAAIALAFAAQGDHVTISGRRRAPLDALAEGTGFQVAQADISDEAQVARLFEAPYDVVVANAGIGHAARVAKTDLEDWNRVLATNLTGVFLTFRAALEGMGPGGRLIAVASTASLQGGKTLAAYSAAKHGVLGLVRSLAKEVAKSEITVNALCPGFVDTEIATQAAANLAAKFAISPQDAMAMLTRPNPMERLIRPDEVASAALFLASPGASSVNGHALTISGGEL